LKTKGEESTMEKFFFFYSVGYAARCFKNSTLLIDA